MQRYIFCDSSVTIVQKTWVWGRSPQPTEAIGGLGARPSDTEQLFVISKLKVLNFSLDFLKIVTILSGGVIDNRMLCEYECPC